MGNPLFGVDIAGIIGDAFSGQLLKATLKQYVPGTRTPGNLSGGTNPTTSTHADIDAFMEEYAEGQIDGTRVITGDRKVVLIGESLPPGVVPGAGDRIDIESFVNLQVIGVKRDPAAATYTCQVRG